MPVQNDFSAQILLVEIFPKIRERDDRKFQALALMNAHQTNRVFFRDRRDFRLGLDFTLRLYEFQKTEQTLPLKLIESFREVQKSLDVCVPLRSARPRFEPVVKMRFRQNCFETLRERRLLRQFPPARKSLQKFSNF